VLLQTMIIDIEGYFTIVWSSKPTVSLKKPWAIDYGSYRVSRRSVKVRLLTLGQPAENL